MLNIASRGELAQHNSVSRTVQLATRITHDYNFDTFLFFLAQFCHILISPNYIIQEKYNVYLLTKIIVPHLHEKMAVQPHALKTAYFDGFRVSFQSRSSRIRRRFHNSPTRPRVASYLSAVKMAVQLQRSHTHYASFEFHSSCRSRIRRRFHRFDY